MPEKEVQHGGRRAEECVRAGDGTVATQGSGTDEQKAAIAEARTVHDARVAEREILHRDALRKAKTHEEDAKLDNELAQDRDRLARDRDRKIAQIREGR